MSKSEEPTGSGDLIEPSSDDLLPSEVGLRNRKAAMPFILLTLFIDILGIGIVIPVLPELVKDFLLQEGVHPDEVTSVASWYVGMISASYALMQFFFAPILGALSDPVSYTHLTLPTKA